MAFPDLHRTVAIKHGVAAAELEDAGLGLWIWEPKPDRLHLSPRWAASFGLTDQDGSVPLALWRELLHTDDRSKWRAALDAQLAGGAAAYQLEYRVRDRAGHWRWLHERGARQGANVAGLQLDITRARQTEAELTDSYGLFAAVFAAVGDGIVVIDPKELRFASFNDAACGLLGYDRQSFGKLRPEQIELREQTPEHAQPLIPLLRELAEKGGSTSAELALRGADGQPRAVAARFSLVQRGGRTQLLGVWADAEHGARIEAAGREAKAALAACNARLGALFDNTQFGVAELSLDGRLVRCNAALAGLLASAADSLAGVKLAQLTHPRDQGRDREQAGQLLAGEIDSYRARKYLLTADGKPRPSDWTVSLLRGAGRKPVGFSAIIEDPRPRLLLKRQAAAAQALSSRMMELVGDAVLLCRAVGKVEGSPAHEIVAVNPPAQRLLGLAEPKLVGRRLLAALPTLTDGDLPAVLWGLDHHRSERVTATLPAIKGAAGDGAEARRCTLTLGATETGEVLLVLQTDAEVQAALPTQPGQVERDALTGLPGLGLFQDRIDQAIAAAEAAVDAAGKGLAVCCLDLDRFKAVNEAHGHDVGDAVLKQLGERLRRGLPHTDTLARVGGDDFGLLMTDFDSVEACTERLQALLDSAREPFQVGAQTLELTAGIGVALYPRDGEQAAPLLRHATHALLRANERGPGGIQFADGEADGLANAHREHLEQLEQSLALDELQLHLLPVVDLVRGTSVAAEALVRWVHPEHGLLGAASVLPDRAGAHLLRRIDLWMLDHALPLLHDWIEQGIELRLHINVSSQTLIHGGFIDVLRMLLDAYPLVPPDRLVIEIQESAASADLATVAETIRAGRALGVGFALDNFGTGASSMTYFRDLPAQQIKIDKSFVRDMLEDRDARNIVIAIAGLAQAFERNVIAEGVESAAQAGVLREVGCCLAQGFGIAEPMPANDLPQWLASWRLPEDWTAAADAA